MEFLCCIFHFMFAISVFKYFSVPFADIFTGVPKIFQNGSETERHVICLSLFGPFFSSHFLPPLFTVSRPSSRFFLFFRLTFHYSCFQFLSIISLSLSLSLLFFINSLIFT